MDNTSKKKSASRSAVTANAEKYPKFAKRLSELMEANAENDEALGKAVGVSQQAINQYRKKIAFPKTETLLTLAEHFGCSLNYLVGLSDVFSPDTRLEYICEYTGLSPASLHLLHGLKEDQPREFKALDRLLSDPDFYIFVLWEAAEYFNSRIDYSDEEKRALPMPPVDIASFHAERAGRMLSTLLEQRDPLKTYNSKFVQAAAAEVFSKVGKKERK